MVMHWFTFILVCVLCSSCTAQTPGGEAEQAASKQPSDQGRSAVAVHIWTSASATTTEDIFDVDLHTRKVTSQLSKETPDGEKPGWAKANLDERTRNRPVYDRIVEKVKASPSPNVDDELAKELRRIEAHKGAGYVPEDFIVASPSGKQVVIRSFGNRPLLVVDVSTLKVHRLLDDAGDQTPPIAWSADSHFLAFAPAITGTLHVYDVQRQTSTVVTRAVPPWIEELSYSPDGTRIVALGLTNRRMDKNPLALVAAGAGHPIFRNDGVLFVCKADGDGAFSVPLKGGISEPSSPRAKIEWK